MKKDEQFSPTEVYSKGYTREQALVSVDYGWADLIHRVFDRLETLPHTPKIVQIKEKFGGLRVYTDYYDETFANFISEIELESYRVCAQCGKPGKLRGKRWYYTSCDIHAGAGDEPHKYQPGDKYAPQEED